MGPSRLRSNNLFYSGRVEEGDGGSIICLSYAWNGRMEVKHNIIVSSVLVKLLSDAGWLRHAQF